MADEPTGELDSTNAYSIFSLFKETVRLEKITVLAATHDTILLEMADVVYELRNGVLANGK